MVLSSQASKADDAQEYCKQAMQLEFERQPGGQGASESQINSMCVITEHTAETWECAVRSMQENEYSMSQALNDCSCKK
jgi:hypothetical protein